MFHAIISKSSCQYQLGVNKYTLDFNNLTFSNRSTNVKGQIRIKRFEFLDSYPISYELKVVGPKKKFNMHKII